MVHMDEPELRIGDRVRLARKEAGLTQSQLAEGIGLSLRAVQQWESGQNRMELHNLLRLAAFVRWPVARFFPPQDESERQAIQADPAFGIGMVDPSGPTSEQRQAFGVAADQIERAVHVLRSVAKSAWETKPPGYLDPNIDPLPKSVIELPLEYHDTSMRQSRKAAMHTKRPQDSKRGEE